MLTALKRIAGVVILAGVLFAAVGPGVARAQETVSPGGVAITPEDVKNAINSPTPNLANTTAYIFYTISVIMTGTFQSELSAGSTQAYAPQSISAALSQGGMVGGVGFLMSALIGNPPASFGYYASDLLRHSRFGATPAYAQGIGFGALTPILGTWNAFKNVAYYLLTIMFFITGFLILIRHKISGNVAVTVQNALPRLVITLIVITFSYAIAGLMVDLMFLAIYFIINVFASEIFLDTFTFGGVLGTVGQIVPPGTSTPEALRFLAFDTNIFSFTINYIFGGAAWSVASAVGGLVYTALTGITGLEFLRGEAFTQLFGNIIGIIFLIIFAVALLIAMFRVFFQLIMSYAGFILNVVLSPLILLEGAIPGRNPWTNWLKNLAAGLLPFVVVIFMIFLALAVSGVNTPDNIGYHPEKGDTQGFRPPLILAGVDSADAFLGILAMGFMLLLPEAVKISQQAVGAKGGPLEQFAQKAAASLKQGISGGEVVPGLGFTKVPGAQRLMLGTKESRAAMSKEGASRITKLTGQGLLGLPVRTASEYLAGRRAGAVTAGPGQKEPLAKPRDFDLTVKVQRGGQPPAPIEPKPKF